MAKPSIDQVREKLLAVADRMLDKSMSAELTFEGQVKAIESAIAAFTAATARTIDPPPIGGRPIGVDPGAIDPPPIGGRKPAV